MSIVSKDLEKDIEKASGDSPASPKRNNARDTSEENFQPKTARFWAVMASLLLGMFLVALDRTIVATAIPRITEEFHSLGDIGWYGSAYQLTTAASQLVFGRVYKFYETKRTFLFAILVFEIGSLICGVAPNSDALIVGRAIAGLGGAGIMTGAIMITIPLIPLRKRPAFQGLFASMFGIASILGPLIGGGFTDGVSWRWCFYMNLPIGGFAVVCLTFFLHLPKTRHESPPTIWHHFTRLDPLGTFFFVPSIVCLVLGLEWGGSTYPWNNWRVILLMVFFGVLLLAFATVQILMPDTATVPVRVITQRSILASATLMFCLAGAMMMVVYYTPLWFQVIQGISALKSGIYTLPVVLSLVVASIISGVVTTKIGYYVPAMLISPSMMAVGLGLMSTFKPGETSAHWIGYQFLAGFGLGWGMQSASLAAQAVLPAADMPTGTAIMFFAQQLGGAVFTSVGQNLLSSRLIAQIGSLLPGADAAGIVGGGASDLLHKVPPELRPQVTLAYNDSITRIFLCGMGLALAALVAALFVEWVNIKKVGRGGPPAEETAEETEPPRRKEEDP